MGKKIPDVHHTSIHTIQFNKSLDVFGHIKIENVTNGFISLLIWFIVLKVYFSSSNKCKELIVFFRHCLGAPVIFNFMVLLSNKFIFFSSIYTS